jgi:hypothetical protein
MQFLAGSSVIPHLQSPLYGHQFLKALNGRLQNLTRSPQEGHVSWTELLRVSISNSSSISDNSLYTTNWVWLQYCCPIGCHPVHRDNANFGTGIPLLASLSSYIIHEWMKNTLRQKHRAILSSLQSKYSFDIYDTRMTLGHVSRIKELGLPGKWNMRQLVVFFEFAYWITTQVKASTIPEWLWWGGLGNGPGLLAKVLGSTFASMLNQSSKRDAQNTNFQPTKTCRKLGSIRASFFRREIWYLVVKGLQWGRCTPSICLIKYDTERAVEGDQADYFTRTVRLCRE